MNSTKRLRERLLGKRVRVVGETSEATITDVYREGRQSYVDASYYGGRLVVRVPLKNLREHCCVW